MPAVGAEDEVGVGGAQDALGDEQDDRPSVILTIIARYAGNVWHRR